MPKLHTIAYPVYKDVSCQFLSSLEVTYHSTPLVRQGWGKLKFKINGRDYNMNFKDIGRVMGFQDLEDSSLPKCENLPTELWKLITGNRHSTGTDKNSHIRHPYVTIVKKTRGKLEAEKQEAERKESALRGKTLASKPAGYGTQRTSRQQTLATKKSKE
ncbi:hypothetical protein F2Q70_00035456 [Brassica cretica]|uniref:Arabidopsis retrotransposon Orf1 C-terminal domain-containing protein n=1 Tax=Brassica cretica TaxID=69181 RepID=A0A8S9K0B2_BRACR|nr:hypothetical protein F2Q70_00035456 [Brassica cretica]